MLAGRGARVSVVRPRVNTGVHLFSTLFAMEASTPAVENATAAAAGGEEHPTFSLELNQDQKDIRDWVHGFAENVVRPAAARVGRARGDPVADHPGGRQDRPLRLRGARAVLRRPDRPDAADRQRGALLGRRRHRHGDHGHRRSPSPRSSARAPASRSASGSRAASAPPTTSRSPRSAPPSPTPAPTSRHPHDAPSTTRPPTSGSSTARRPGPPTAASPTSTSSSPPSTPSSARAATPRSSSRCDTKGIEQGAKVKKHGLRASHTADVHLDDCRVPGSTCSAARRSSTSASPASARARRARRRPRCRPSRPPARPSARRRSASPAPPTSTRSTTPRSASSSARRSSRTRRSRSRSPT